MTHQRCGHGVSAGSYCSECEAMRRARLGLEPLDPDMPAPADPATARERDERMARWSAWYGGEVGSE